MLRGLNRTDRQNTWSHCRDNLISLARLNRFYSFKHHFNICQNCQIFPVSMSYHSLVQCTFHIQNIKLHSAYWNFNTNLLNDIFFFFFLQAFVFLWCSHQKNKSGYSSVQWWWYFGKSLNSFVSSILAMSPSISQGLFKTYR